MMDLAEKIDRLPNMEDMRGADSWQGMIDAASRLVATLNMELRAAHHERLLAQEQLSKMTAAAIATDERVARLEAEIGRLGEQLSMARQEGGNTYNLLADERGRRVDAQSELIAMREEVRRQREAAAAPEGDQTEEKILAVVQQLQVLVEQMAANAALQKAQKYVFDIQRDGAGRARRVTASPSH